MESVVVPLTVKLLFICELQLTVKLFSRLSDEPSVVVPETYKKFVSIPSSFINVGLLLLSS